MPDNKPAPVRRETLIEKIIRRLLETVGGSVDRVFGRGKKPDALPQTGDLAERLRKMVDKQAQVNQDGRKLAPHLIRLKYAWGQSSDEFLAALKRLKNELLVVAIDHINDNRYTTLAPVKVEAKADILTTGFTMSVAFDEGGLQNAEQVEVPVEIYAKLLPDYKPEPAQRPLEIEMKVTATFPGGKERRSTLIFVPEKKENLIVGRMKECDLYLDDVSVSKHHASLVMNKEGILRLADIGSTNGTYVGGNRISYGKAYDVAPETTISFGDVTARFEWKMPEPEPEIVEEPQPVEAENVETFEMPDGEIKIGVKSAEKRQQEETDEPKTVLGEEVEGAPETVLVQPEEEIAGFQSSNYDREQQMAVTTNLPPIDALETNELDSVVGKPTNELDSVISKPTNEFETLNNKHPEQVSADVTNKLDSNALDEEEQKSESLVGFDSLLGTSPTDLQKKPSKLSDRDLDLPD